MNDFLTALDKFRDEVKAMPSFKGKAQALRALRRIRELAIFSK